MNDAYAGVATTSAAPREHLNIIHPDEGKRYKLNIRTPVGRLTIGKVKQCLAAASSCPIPLQDMVLHLNGVPLGSDQDVCASLGIGSGATLSVEARHASPHERGSAASLPMSDQRRLLELQTLQRQSEMLHTDVAVRDDVLRHTLHNADDAIDLANLRRRQLERQRQSADEELRRVQEKEAEAMRERQQLAALQAQEAVRATERAAQLATRREQIRAEQEAARSVAMLKLENEKKKALLAQQQAFMEAERERAQLEQASFEATTKARALELRAREIDAEHRRLANIRDARALDADRRLAVTQRLRYYADLGVDAPRALQREAAALLANAHVPEDEDEARLSLSHSGGGGGDRSVLDTNGDDGLVRSRGASAAPPPSHAVVAPRAPSAAAAAAPPTASAVTVPDGAFYDARENAEANLRRLGDELGLHDRLLFDSSDTCVISVDGEFTLLVTYDAATERLYLYSTLLAALPAVVESTPSGRLRLCEFLLEASLLGREMCGGGVGASMRHDFILMTASLYMPTSQPWSLRTLTPQFLHCLRHWRAKLAEFFSGLEAEQQQQQQRGGGGGAAPPGSSLADAPPHYFTPASSSLSPSLTRSAPHPSAASAAAGGGGLSSAAAAHARLTAAAAAAVRHVSPSSRSSAAASLSATQAAEVSRPAQPRSSPGDGAAAVRPVLGLEVTGTVMVNGIPTHYDSGVLVVNAAGPAALAGVQPNDVIEELNGVRLRSVADFRRIIEEQLTPGTLVPVRLIRGGVAMVVTVHVEAAWSL
ncbi:Tir chaperone protein (CesT) family/PDZ domain containing protein [Novymonas esmeraldas]|uniref:Tir chaperone protein (CesT) family/PDZ domain containing protein n=1 Tax=Novymonas esmeraldas TaxID=1808958 RepID=A0AAW0FDG7_9TRYP